MQSIIEYLVICRAQDEQHAHEVSRFQEELAEAHSQLQILQKQLDEELAKQPLTNQEVRTLSRGWTEMHVADGLIILTAVTLMP